MLAFIYVKSMLHDQYLESYGDLNAFALILSHAESHVDYFPKSTLYKKCFVTKYFLKAFEL